MKLVIANKNYSSWSFRPWLVMTQANIPFEEEVISFGSPDFKQRVARMSPSKRVPVLIDGDLAVWDSLAIVEYLAERFPDRRLWPADPKARAVARSLCAEMHSGFQLLRSVLPMNFQVHIPGAGWTVQVQREIDRLITMWQDTRARFGVGGPLLFGDFTIADAFFAPIVQRFVAYGVKLPPTAQAYADAVTALSGFGKWAMAARAETEFVQSDEPYRFPPQT